MIPKPCICWEEGNHFPICLRMSYGLMEALAVKINLVEFTV